MGDLGFLNCDDICMCIVNKQSEPLEFVFDYVYVDLKYDKISLTLTAGSVSLCCVCSHVVVFGLTLRLSCLFVFEIVVVPYEDAVVAVTVMCVLLFVCMLKECGGARVTAMLVWGTDEV